MPLSKMVLRDQAGNDHIPIGHETWDDKKLGIRYVKLWLPGNISNLKTPGKSVYISDGVQSTYVYCTDPELQLGRTGQETVIVLSLIIGRFTLQVPEFQC